MIGADASGGGLSVGARDCALAVGIPRTLEQLESQWHDPSFEFVRTEVIPRCTSGACNGAERRFARTPGEAWDWQYRAFAERVCKLVEGIGSFGLGGGPLTVVWDAKLEDVAQLLREFRVVSVVAHSPLRSLTPSDLIDPDAVVRALTGVAGPDHAVIAELRRDPAVGAVGDLRDLLAVLNPKIGASRGFYHFESGALGAHMEQDIGERFTALSLFEALPGAVKPPAVLELADGLHDFEALVRVVPEGFTGVMEFLTCSGMWFAKALRRRRERAEAFLGCHQVAWFLERLVLYKAAIELVSVRPMPYRDAAIAAQREGLRWLAERGGASGPGSTCCKEQS